MAFDASFYADWRTISVMAAALSVIASAALIMLSRLFALKNLEQVAKAEFVFAISTVLIVMMVQNIVAMTESRLASGSNSVIRCLYLSTFTLSCNFPATFTNTNTLIDWMKLYMATPTKCVKKFMNALYALSIPVEAMASIYMEIFMSEHASGFGIKWVAERIGNATQNMAFFMYIYFLLVHILNFIKFYAGFFFSVGVALRAFPPTRGAGAYVMALAFGLYFVFPMSYILVATLSLPHSQENMMSMSADASGSPQYLCSLPEVPDVKSMACGAADIGRVMELPDIIKAYSSSLETILSFQMTAMQNHLIHAICIFPMIAFVILLTFVLNTTNLFGGNIPEIGRGLVKLI